MSDRTVVETERLKLREFSEGDVEAYFNLGSDPKVTQFTGTGVLKDKKHALEILRANPLRDYECSGLGRWACVYKPNGEVIGFAGLKRLDDPGDVDIAIWLLPDYWGAGLATEAGLAILKYGFENLHLEEIVGLVDPENTASVRLLEKLGMHISGRVLYQGEETSRYVIASGNSPISVPE